MAFPYRKVVDEYWDPVDPTSLLSNFVAMFKEVTSLLNSCAERTVTLNDIAQHNNKVMGDESKKTANFHRLERIMEEAMSKFQSVVEA